MVGTTQMMGLCDNVCRTYGRSHRPYAAHSHSLPTPVL